MQAQQCQGYRSHSGLSFGSSTSSAPPPKPNRTSDSCDSVQSVLSDLLKVPLQGEGPEYAVGKGYNRGVTELCGFGDSILRFLCCRDDPSTQYLRLLVPTSIEGMVLPTEHLANWVLELL